MTTNHILEETQTATLTLPEKPALYYRHGWQSWSPAMWIPADSRLTTPRPSRVHPLQYDAAFIRERAPHGSWVGAAKLENGEVFLLGALGMDAHVFLRGGVLEGRASTPIRWFLASGAESEVFDAYANALRDSLDASARGNPPRVWCSWYSFYTHISEARLRTVLEDLRGEPFEVFQIDDGWQRGIGDWHPNEKFPSGMDGFAKDIRAAGLTPGLWAAPLLLTRHSPLLRETPGVLLRDSRGKPVSAGFNWGEPLYALDTTHPAAQDYLREMMARFRAWGYDYLKLDFLYAGALEGVRFRPMPREAAYREALRLMREAMGQDVYLLACGAPILPSLGLCDGLRIGPDVAPWWENHRDAHLFVNPAMPGAKNAIRTSLHRLWLRPLAHTDPDVVYFRTRLLSLDESQKRILQETARRCNFRATSDVPKWMTKEERAALRAFLEETPLPPRRVLSNPFDGMPDSVLQPDSPPDALSRGLGAALGAVSNLSFVLRANWAFSNLYWSRKLRALEEESSKTS